MDKMVILVVEDNKEVLKLIMELLGVLGATAKGFDNPTDALKYFSQNSKNVAAIITDFTLPKMNGVEFAMLAKEIDGSARILLITGLEPREISPESNIILIFEGILGKPFTFTEFKEAISTMLSDEK